MSCRTIFTKIHVELVVFFFQSQFIHSCFQLIVVILSLASSDDLTDSRYQTVYCRNGLAIVVQLHVECFDLLRIICYEYRTFEDFFCQVSFVLCLKVCSPCYFVFKFIIVFLKKFYSLCICHSCEIRRYYVVQSLQKSLVYE